MRIIVDPPGALVLNAPGIPDHDGASRYISAIVVPEPHASLGRAYVEWRAGLFWEHLVSGYGGVASGPYARHGGNALSAAIGRL
jgi:hypothetical protein